MPPARAGHVRGRTAFVARALALLLLALLGLQAMVPSTAAAAGPLPTPVPTQGSVSPTPSVPLSSVAASPATAPAPTPTPTPRPAPTPRASTAPAPTPSATAAPPAAGTAAVTSDAAVAAAPALSVQVTTAPTPVTQAGQPVTYTVTVANTGTSPLRDTVVTAVAVNLHALTCAPTAQGGTLVAGATTTCTGTRTSAQEDLRTHGSTVSATATGYAPDGSTVSKTATARLAVTTAPPKATDDVVATTFGTPVVVPASTNDGPAVPGGPALDPGRTVFKQPYHPEANADTKYAASSHGEWFVRADGSVLFVPRADNRSGGTDTLPYRVFDSAGQSAVANLSVTVRQPLQAVPDPVTVKQGLQVVAYPLKNDKPGQQADGTPASLVESSIRFTDAQPVGNAVVAAGGTEVDLPFIGHLGIGYPGEIVFSAVPTFTGRVSVAYSVTDSVGNTGSSTLDITVTPQVPTARDLSVFAGYDVSPSLAVFPWKDIDTSPVTGVHVDFDGFTGPDGSPLGKVVYTPQGDWFFRDDLFDGPQLVGFDATVGFSGTTSIGYTLVDFNGTRATARFTVIVRPGPTTRPDVLVSRRGADATVDPGANDTPGLRADGKPGSFNARYAQFPVDGQPEGSVVANNNKTLTLPGRGQLWFTNGTIHFRPQAGFAGDAGTVSYQVEDRGPSLFERGLSAVGRVHLVVTADRPVATDDTAVTPYGRSVTLPGSTDDDPGSVPGPLVASFPALGQPGGSAVRPDGRSVSVPDEGVWTLLASGAATFTPATGFVGGTSAVLYRSTRTDGASDTGTLQVTVAQGIRADPVSVLRAQGQSSVVDPLAHTVPGYDVDGTIGTLDHASVRFALSGQPLGATVSAEGRGLTFARGSASTGFAFSIDDAGLVHVTVPRGYRGVTPKVRFTVQGTVTDSAGATVRQQAGSTVVVTITGRDPVAVDDAITVTAPPTPLVILPAGLNDIPASASLPLDPYDASFPYDQLPGLPKGSRIVLNSTYIISYWTATIPGEGNWQIDPYTGKAIFEPVIGFVGTTTPLRYRVPDAAGNTAEGTLTVTVRPVPDPPDTTATGTTPQGVPVAVDVAADDTPGLAAVGSSFGYPQPEGAKIPEGSNERTLVVPGEGTYSIGYGSTAVRFTPVKSFRGTTRPVKVWTSSIATILNIRVTGVDPLARDDAASTSRGVPVRIRLLDNDAPGSPTRSLVASSVRLTAQGLPVGATLSADGQTLSVPARGVFAAAGDGTVTFYPSAGATGTVPTVGYVVSDVNQTRAQASVTVRIG